MGENQEEIQKPLTEGERWRIILEEEREKARLHLKNSVVSAILLTALAVFMILHTLEKRTEREHIKRYHPAMLKEYDQQEYEASVESRDRRG